MTLAQTQTGRSAQPWLILLLLAAGTRLIGLNLLEPWYDEVGSYAGAVESSWSELLRWRVALNPEHSPLSFMEIKAAMTLLGPQPWVMRLPSALYGVLAVMALYAMLRRLVNPSVAWWSALLLTAHPYALEWNREARMYGPWLCAVMLMIWCAAEAVRNTSTDVGPRTPWRWWAALGLLFMIAHAQTLHAVPSIAAVMAWLLLVAAVEWRRRRQNKLAASLLAGAVLSLLIYIFNWSSIGLLKLSALREEPVESTAKLMLPTPHRVADLYGELAGYVPLPVGVALWFAAAAGLILLARHGQRRLALLIAITALASWALYPSIIARHFYVSRYLMVHLAAWCVGVGALASWGWRHPRRRLARPAVVALLLALGMLWAPAWEQIFLVPKNRVAAVMTPIRQFSEPTHMLAVIPPSYGIFLHYHRFGEAQVVSDWWNVLVSPEGEARPVLPLATWLLIADPALHLKEMAFVLAVYGHDPEPHLARLRAEFAGGATLLSARVSREGFGPIFIAGEVRTTVNRLHRGP